MGDDVGVLVVGELEGAGNGVGLAVVGDSVGVAVGADVGVLVVGVEVGMDVIGDRVGGAVMGEDIVCAVGAAVETTFSKHEQLLDPDPW